MTLSPVTLQNLFRVYQNNLDFALDVHLETQAFNEACQAINNQLSDYFDWVRLGESDVNPELSELLKACLVTLPNRTVVFDALAAKKTLIVKQQTISASKLYLDAENQTAGIQERYLKSQLTAEELLNYLDIKRFITYTGMQNHIKVAKLDVQEIGLILHDERLNHADSREPYTVSMMLNAGESTHAKWVAVSIKIDPTNRKANYKVYSGEKLTDSQRDALETSISNSIKFEAVSPTSGQTFSAFPREFEVLGTSYCHDSAYHLLHALYKDDALSVPVAASETALAFSRQDAQIRILKQEVYQAELQAIRITPEQAALLPTGPNFRDGRILDAALQNQLSLLGKGRVEVAVQHPLVIRRLAEIQLYHQKVNFPGDRPETLLTPKDYQQFLLLLNQKYKHSGLDKVLDEMEIACFDGAALEGLIAYNQTFQALPFKTLVLNLDAIDLSNPLVCENFLFHLKTLMVTMTDNHLPILKFKDTRNQLSVEIQKKLVDFIVFRKVAIDIHLPGPHQKTIDEFVFDQIRHRNISMFGKVSQIPDYQQVQEVRKRPRIIGQQSLSIDIELQQEQQVEVAVEANMERGISGLGGEEPADIVYTWNEFQFALSRGLLDREAKSYLVPSDISSVKKMWLNWTGALTILEAEKPSTGIRLSKTACEELLRYKEKFQYGLDFKNLPAGFVLKKVGPISYVHFDKKLKLISEYEPLKVQTSEMTGEKPLAHGLFKQWLDFAPDEHPIKVAWVRLNSVAYQREASLVFKQFLPQMLLLDATAQGRLFALCFNVDGQFDTQKFQFLLENSAQLKQLLPDYPHDGNIDINLTQLFAGQKREALIFINAYDEVKPPFDTHLLNLLFSNQPEFRTRIRDFITQVNDIDLNALLQLYSQFGQEGLTSLIQLANTDIELFKQLNTRVFSKTKTYATVLNPDMQDAIKAIKGFGREERIWWDRLLRQHTEAQSNINLIDLVNAFKGFLIQLQELLTHDGQILKLSESCELTGVKSMPVALSRMLTLLKHVSQQNRYAQWCEISKLDLSSTGMIKPISISEGKQFAFITPEMAFNTAPNTENLRQTPHGYEIIAFDPILEEIAIGSVPNLDYQAPSSWNRVSSDLSVTQNFFRYVAYQEKNHQLPLDFYRYTYTKIEASGLSERVKTLFYPLIAGATTGHRNICNLKLQDAKNNIDSLIKMLIDTSLPRLAPERLKEFYRENLLGILAELADVPPLNILEHLIRLISTSLSNPLTIYRNGPRLVEASERLYSFVRQHGFAVYEGMKDYREEDYANQDLFFNHLALVQQIDNHYTERHMFNAAFLIRLISSFSLNSESLTPILNTYFADRNDRLHEALHLLSHLSLVEHPLLRKLTHADLNLILRELDTNRIQSVTQIIKELRLNDGQALSAYFANDFLDHYDKSGIPESVNRKIEEHFREGQRPQIAKILLRFSAPGDSLRYDGLVDKLIAITKTLSPAEKNLFITKLTTNLGLYTPIQTLSDEGNNFIKLLDSIIASHSIDGFMNFIASERHLYQHSSEAQLATFFTPYQGEKVMSGLAQKASLYLKAIAPKFRNQEDLVISSIDLAPRLHEVLLKTPLAQLNSVSTVVSDKLDVFLAQENTLSSVATSLTTNNAIDFNAAKTQTEQFIARAGLEDASLFSEYHRKLSELDRVIGLNELQTQRLNDIFSRLDDLIIERYPDIRENRNLFPLLLSNPKFTAPLAIEAIKSALNSDDLMRNQEKIGVVLNGVDDALKQVAAFKQKTSALQRELAFKKAELNQYPTVFINLYKKINKVVKDNPNSKKQFLELYDRFLSHYSPAQDGELLKYLSDFVVTLENSFAKIVDKNIVLSLCLQFNSELDPELKPEGLIKLLRAINGVHANHQTILLKMAVVLINNEKGYRFEDFEGICRLVTEHRQFAEIIPRLYQKAPFAKIEQLMTWHNSVIADGNYAEVMMRAYNSFNKVPCVREEINGFQIEKADLQLIEFKGFRPGLLNVEEFKAKTEAMKSKTSEELLAILKQYNPSLPTYNAESARDDDTLVAVAAELLYRSKGRDGHSMEINTTQYLAILSALKTPGHVTSQIGTGEGKSRIMMISIACQFARGRTVDFVTSDAQLATRDFIEYQAYFEMMDAQTSMIFAQSDPTSYKIGGINFSDPSHLSLFRNKARSLGQGNLVIDPIPSNRSLLLDEADKTYFDVADTRFNFSTESDESIRGMDWIYPLLMDYFSQENLQLTTPINGKMNISPIDLFYENVDLSREKFLEFACTKRSKMDLMRLKALSNAQIEQWQVSAVTASQLKFNEDFVIEPDVLISTHKGPKISSEAQLLFANRVAKCSKFSFGVHQCLHARLNLARNHLDSLSDTKLRAALQRCEQAFYVPDEKQIVYSSTSKNLLDDYSKGTLKGVTGTSGALIERQEAQQLYGLASENAVTKMHFIDVPRHKEIKRKDRAIRLTKNTEQQIDTLVLQIKEARQKQQPILIIAENDQESEFLFQKISAVFANDTKLQHIHSQLTPKVEKERIHKAGSPGQITISTDMIGRGTDISLQGASSDYGLHVMLTYLPRTRDLAQIIGRSGRFGAKGEASIILNKERLKKQLGKTTLTDGFYGNTEAYIRREQALMDRLKQCERLIKNAVGDFKKGLTQEFFEKMLTQIDRKDHKTLLPIWTKLFDESDKAWNEIWPLIQKELRASRVNVVKVQELFGLYSTQVQKMWNSLRRQVSESTLTCLDGQKPIDKLSVNVPVFTLSLAIQNLLTRFNIHSYRMDRWQTYDHYEAGHDGRAVEYSSWLIPLIASLKGYANLLPYVHFDEARKPFANFRAWLDEHGCLFPNLRASENRARIISATLFSMLGAGAMAALILTGILAPAITALWAFLMYGCFFGFGAGAILGYGIGSMIDSARNTEQVQLLQPALA